MDKVTKPAKIDKLSVLTEIQCQPPVWVILGLFQHKQELDQAALTGTVGSEETCDPPELDV